MQNYTSNNKIKENKYKILRMSLLLGSDDNKEETLKNFEEAAREIDAMNDEIYLSDLEKKFYDTTKLEDEEKKLADLVDYIGGRVEQRISLLTDFENITGYDLTNLPPIKYYDKLDDYKERLKYIQEYLVNIKEINELTKEIETDEFKLKDAYMSKATFEESNIRNEEILQNKYKNILENIDDLKNLDESNIDELLTDITYQTEESKKSLEIFTKSFKTLANAGISKQEEEEYRSYVENAKDLFYENKENEYLLRIFKILQNKEQEYGLLIEKRNEINKILAERLELRRTLHIADKDDLLISFYEILDKQYDEIVKQKNIIENIDELNKELSINKDKINELELENQKVEILSLLREYGIIETYTEEVEENKEELPTIEEPIEENEQEEKIEELPQDDIFSINLNTNNKEEIQNEQEQPIEEEKIEEAPIENNDVEQEKEVVPEETVIPEEAKDNQIINIEPANNIDLELIKSKANKVMKRVGEMLGIKIEETTVVSVENKEEKIEEPTIPENPLFSNTVEQKEEVTSPTEEPQEQAIDTNFWFPSETPDALNELPDLEEQPQENNFFTNNNMSDLNFPDLNVGFDNNDTEVQ